MAKSLWLGWHPRLVGMLALLLLAVPMLATIWNVYQRANAILEESIQRQLLGAAQAIAQTIDPALHGTFQKPEQEASEAYVHQIEIMDRAKTALDPKAMIKFVYTCIAQGDEIRFVLDTTPAGDADHDGQDDKSHVMEVYETPSETLRQVLKSGVAMVDHTPYQDRWGTFMSGYAPIFDSKNAVIGAAGVDIELTEYVLQQSGLRRVAVLSALGAVCVSCVAGIGVAAYHRRLQRSVSQLLKAGDAAMAAVRTKSDFLAAMSHELRTPMNAVLGMTELLRDTRLDEQQMAFVGTIQSSGESLLNTITDILDFSQLDAGQMNVELVPLDVAALIDGLRSQFKSELSARGLTFVSEIDGACPRRILGDPTHIKQVLRHLILNAIKFTGAGSINMSVKPETTENGSPGLHLTVKDTGIGMDATQQAQLFQPFSQADITSTRRHGGTGIGLAICKRLCDVMKGRIWVESQLGKGSAFHLLIPAEAVVDAKPVASSLAALVWSQDSMTQLLVSRVLKKLGHRALVVQTPGEVISALANQRFDWVLADAAVLHDIDVRSVRDAAQGARMIAINAEPGRFADGAFDAVLDSPVRPADLREVLS